MIGIITLAHFCASATSPLRTSSFGVNEQLGLVPPPQISVCAYIHGPASISAHGGASCTLSLKMQTLKVLYERVCQDPLGIYLKLLAKEQCVEHYFHVRFTFTEDELSVYGVALRIYNLQIL